MEPVHKWDYCGICKCAFVRCGICGNNCCNAGHGEIDGKECPGCESTYELQAREPDPVFDDEYMKLKIKEAEDFWNTLFPESKYNGTNNT